MAKNLIDYISEEDYPRYQQILDDATAAKATAPKQVRSKGPQSLEAKIKAAETRAANTKAKLDAMLAARRDNSNTATATAHNPQA